MLFYINLDNFILINLISHAFRKTLHKYKILKGFLLKLNKSLLRICIYYGINTILIIEIVNHEIFIYVNANK